MDERTRALVRLSASLTASEAAQAKAMEAAARIDGEAAEEVLLQSYLFLGYPVALNALGLWRRRTRRPPSPPREPPESGGWEARGERVCAAVYGRQYAALREVMAAAHPELDRWAVTEGYGKVLGRPGLELGLRELCIAAMLSGTTSMRQLHSHLRGCLNVGASPREVADTLDAVAGIVGEERAREARRVWERVLARWNRKQED